MNNVRREGDFHSDSLPPSLDFNTEPYFRQSVKEKFHAFFGAAFDVVILYLHEGTPIQYGCHP